MEHYLKQSNQTISRAQAEERMLTKLHRNLTADVVPLLPVGVRYDNDVAVNAFNLVWTELITRISGKPWKLSEKMIFELRDSKFPNLLPS